MAYEKQTWQTGDVITAEKLNYIEDGIGGNILVVSETMTRSEQGIGTHTLGKTWNEINTALSQGMIVVTLAADEYGALMNTVTATKNDDPEYIVDVRLEDEIWYYKTDSPNGYPIYSGGR